MLVPEFGSPDISLERLPDLIDAILSDDHVSGWKFQVDGFWEVTLYKRSVEIDCCTFQSLSNGEDEQKADCTPIDDRRVSAFGLFQDLEISTNDEAGFKFVNLAVGSPFSSERPSGFDDLFALWHFMAHDFHHGILVPQSLASVRFMSIASYHRSISSGLKRWISRNVGVSALEAFAPRVKGWNQST